MRQGVCGELNMKQTVIGFQANSYSASFEQRTYFFEEKHIDNQRNIRITDANSGLEIILVVETPSQKAKRNKKVTNNISRKTY